MKILFIAPLPPPVSGHSLASKVFFDELTKHHRVEVINLRKESFKQGIDSFDRIVQIIKILKEIWHKRRNVDSIYFTISESLAGNIKDLFIYLLCFRSLRKMAIHLHGGSIRKLIFDKYKLLYLVNRFFIRRLGSSIVLGQSHVDIFLPIIPKDRIQIVPNFAEDHLFIDQKGITDKFENIAPIRILFLSNLIQGKGYTELADTFLALDDNLKKQIVIDFAGSFESAAQKAAFIERIQGQDQIHYHGFVQGEEKKNLLSKAHIFCLPTCLLEGQPISILEAYASGCVVITTNQGGICDIFKNRINGFEVQKKSVHSIKVVIEEILKNPAQLLSLAITNRKMADAKYRTSIYNASLLRIVENMSHETRN